MIQLETAHVEAMIEHAKREAPNEAAGLLIGHGALVERVLPVRSATPSPVAFHLDPEEQYRIFVEMEDAGEELVGIFHSHVRSPAYPSATDVRMAYSPEVYVVIVSLHEPERPSVRAFKIDGQTVLEQSIGVR